MIKFAKTNKNTVKYIFTLIFFAFLNFCFSDAVYACDEYEITSYSINVTVNENNVVNVVELMSVVFKDECEYISKFIPLEGTFNVEQNGDIREAQYSAEISDVKVLKTDFEIHKEGSNVILDIFPKDDETIQNFNLFYTLDFGDDGIGDFDSFYFNLIPDNVEANIKTAIFHIEMPEKIDDSSLNIYNNDGDDIEYRVDDNKIYFSLSDKELKNDLVVQIILPEGYYKNVNTQYNWYPLYYVGTIFLLVLVMYAFIMFGKDNKISPKYEFYPPDNLSPAEVGYIIDGHISSKDLISLILFWANKGFLKLIVKNDNEIEIVKIKSLPKEAYDYEKKMFNELFRHRNLNKNTFIDLIAERKSYRQYFKEVMHDEEIKLDFNLISSKDFKFAIYPNISNIAKRIKRKYAKDKKVHLFTRMSKFIKALVLITFSLPILIGSLMLNLQGVLYTDTISIIIKSILLTAGIITIFLITNRWTIIWNSTMTKYKQGRVFIILFFMFSSIFLCLKMLLFNESGNMIVALVAIFSTYMMGILALFMDKRTYRSNVLLSKVLGLKMFVKDASSAQIMDLVNKNDKYFFEMIPYVYVLGISDVWAQKFESMRIPTPEWFTTKKHASYINAEYFVKILHRAFNPVQS